LKNNFNFQVYIMKMEGLQTIINEEENNSIMVAYESCLMMYLMVMVILILLYIGLKDNIQNVFY
jgi:hypothetical protein